MTDTSSKELRLVMVGKTGSGKSALGNSLLQSKRFQSNTSGSSITEHCKFGTRNLDNGKKMIVVDTPGIFDTRKNNLETAKEIVRCIGLSSPGPHIFLFVLMIGRFTQEETDTIQQLKDLFGQDVLNHVLVVFTGKDSLDYDKSTIDQHIKDSPAGLRSLVDECQRRVATINNRANPTALAKDIKAILDFMDKIVKENSGGHYTGEMFEGAERAYQEKLKRLEEEKHKKERELERRAQEIERNAEQKMQEIEYMKLVNKKKEEELKRSKKKQDEKERELEQNALERKRDADQKMREIEDMKVKNKKKEEELERSKEKQDERERKMQENKDMELKKKQEELERSKEKQDERERAAERQMQENKDMELKKKQEELESSRKRQEENERELARNAYKMKLKQMQEIEDMKEEQKKMEEELKRSKEAQMREIEEEREQLRNVDPRQEYREDVETNDGLLVTIARGIEFFARKVKSGGKKLWYGFTSFFKR